MTLKGFAPGRGHPVANRLHRRLYPAYDPPQPGCGRHCRRRRVLPCTDLREYPPTDIDKNRPRSLL